MYGKRHETGHRKVTKHFDWYATEEAQAVIKKLEEEAAAKQGK